MTEAEKEQLVLQIKNQDLHKCTILHNALTLDKPNGFNSIGEKPVRAWTEEQHKALVEKYYELLLSL